MRMCPRCETTVADDRFVFCGDECFEAYFTPPLENMVRIAGELEGMTIEHTAGGIRATALKETAEAMLRAVRTGSASRNENQRLRVALKRIAEGDTGHLRTRRSQLRARHFVAESQIRALHMSVESARKQIIREILQEVVDTLPWAYTYRERPDDLIEIRVAELEAILEAHIHAD